jgi:hypothetical protein
MVTFKQSNKVLAIIFYLIYNLNQCLISAGQLDNMNHEMPTDANQFSALQMSNPQMGQMGQLATNVSKCEVNVKQINRTFCGNICF